MATTPQYAATPGRANVQVSTANTAIDGTGGASIVTVVAGTANGRRIRRVGVTGAVAAGVANRISFFISTDNGTTNRFLCDVALSAATVSATIRGQYAEVPELVGLILTGTTHLLRAATHVAQATNIDAEYGDL
jgi:hypothetical protein